jgi:phage FluMu protein gp41
MRRLVRVAAAAALLFSGALLPAGETYTAMVPWRVVEPGGTVDAPLVLFWIPSSVDELRRSDLLSSDELTLFSSRCVAMRVVRLNDDARMAKLEVGDALPMAVLARQDGEIIGRVTGVDGVLSVVEVEALVREELDRRTTQAEELLDRARVRAEANDHDAALAMYQSVWDARCLCPRQGKDAKKALRKLGRR